VGRKSLSGALSIWANGERVGIWRVSPQGEDELRYDRAWFTSGAGRPLSLSLPLIGEGVHRGAVVRNYFDNLLPDSQIIRERLAQRFRTESAGAFDLLQAVGRDCVGAIQLLGEDAIASNVQDIDGVALTESQIEQLLIQAVSSQRLASEPLDELRISLAGAQEKTALLWHENQWLRPRGATPTTHILKLPLGFVGYGKADFSTSVENEWLCLNILQEYGLTVPRCAILRFGAQKVLAVERFDRRMHSSGRWLMRLLQEDFCQALGLPPHLKYESDGGPGLVALAGVLRQSVDAHQDLGTLLKAQILFWMLGAPDGHAKNFSISLLPLGRYKLAPLYDVMSIWPVEGNGAHQVSKHRLKMAMALLGKNRHYRFKEILRRHFNATALRCQYGADAEDLIEQVLAATPGVIERVSARLPEDFPASVSNRVLGRLEEAAKALARMPPS
jgi:serine/threonine-protein kinase HipA